MKRKRSHLVIGAWVDGRQPEDGQALRIILSSEARIDEVFHVRLDKIFADEERVELTGKGGRVHKVQVLHGNILQELDLSQRFVYLRTDLEQMWKYDLGCVMSESKRPRRCYPQSI